MGFLGSIERQLLEAFGDKLEVETTLDDERLLLVTTTWFDGEHVNQHEWDLAPLIDLLRRELDI